MTGAEKLIEKLSKLAMGETKLTDSDKMELIRAVAELKNNLKDFQTGGGVTSKDSISISGFIDYVKKQTAKGKAVEKSLFGIISQATQPPFTHPQAFFERDATAKVTLDRGGDWRDEVSESEVLKSFYPGGFTARWGWNYHSRIPCGRYQDNGFEANLHDPLLGHQLTHSPITQYFDGRDVYGVKKIRVKDLKSTKRLFGGQLPVCPTCLSLKINVDEGCEHFDNDGDYVRRQNLSPQVILTRFEDPTKRKSNPNKPPKSFPFPLSDIFEKVNFLEQTEVFTVAKGFTRTSRGNGGPIIVEVGYDPYLGYSTKTKGVLFKLKAIQDDYIKEIQNDDIIVRDITVDLIHECVLGVLKSAGRSVWENDLWTSGFVKALGLDSVTSSFDYKKSLKKIKETSFVQTLIDKILEECNFYEAGTISQGFITPAIIRDILDEVKRDLRIDNGILIDKIKNLLKNSIAYLVYTTSLLIAGSTKDEIGFVPPNEKNPDDIVIFDATNGGNGASELIYNFLTSDIQATTIGYVNANKGIKPTYFQEIFYELLLPCQQGVADRIFFQDYETILKNMSPRKNLLVSSIDDINEEKDISPTEFQYVSGAGIQNMYPLGVGLRYSREAAPKIHQIATICVHGCFDCLLLNESIDGKLRDSEKFFVSKYLVDRYFRFLTNKRRINSSESIVDIEAKLGNDELILMVEKLDKNNSSLENSELLSKTDQLIGKKINDKIVKLCGFWIDCPLSASGGIEAVIMFGLLNLPVKKK